MRALKDNEQMYTMGPQKKIPFAWSPQEALRHRKFSTKSDVYSFGVVIWEFFTYGEEPWIGCRAIDVLKHLDAGETLDKPKYSSDRIYQIMKNCWKLNPAERCTFAQIRQDLQAAQFKKACVREPCNSIQPGTLQLNKGDNIELINEKWVLIAKWMNEEPNPYSGDDWFGQCHRTRKFGTFPRSAVFVEYDNSFIAPNPSAQPVFRAPPKEPTPSIAVPIVPNVPKPLNNNTIPAGNDRASRISMPVAGQSRLPENFLRFPNLIPFACLPSCPACRFLHPHWSRRPVRWSILGKPQLHRPNVFEKPSERCSSVKVWLVLFLLFPNSFFRTSNGAIVIDSKTQLTNGGLSTHTSGWLFWKTLPFPGRLVHVSYHVTA